MNRRSFLKGAGAGLAYLTYPAVRTLKASGRALDEPGELFYRISVKEGYTPAQIRGELGFGHPTVRRYDNVTDLAVLETGKAYAERTARDVKLMRFLGENHDREAIVRKVIYPSSEVSVVGGDVRRDAIRAVCHRTVNEAILKRNIHNLYPRVQEQNEDLQAIVRVPALSETPLSRKGFFDTWMLDRESPDGMIESITRV